MIKGSDSVSSVDSGSFWRLLLPAIPPLVVMVACLPVLVPAVRAGAGEALPAARAAGPGRRVLIVAAVLFSFVPLVAAAALQPIGGEGRSIIVEQDRRHRRPVDRAEGDGRREHGAPALERLRRGSATRVFYRVLRAEGRVDTICRKGGGVEDATTGAANCFFIGQIAERTRATSAVDSPGRGTWTYRIGVGANWVDDPKLGDVFTVSAPVTVTVR